MAQVGKKRKMTAAILAVAAVGMSALLWKFAKAPSKSELSSISAKHKGPKVTNFTLLDHKGRSHTLNEYKDHKYIVIMAQTNTCPIVRKYAARYSELKNAFASKVLFIAINPNEQDDRASIATEAQDYNFDFPILLDPSQIVSRNLRLTRASEIAVIDTSDWTIRYVGPIDDRVTYGVDKLTVKNNYLEDALRDLLGGETLEFRVIEAVGCAITYKETENLSFTKHIVPIVQAKCLNCHAEGSSILPRLDSYKSLSGWASMSRETIFDQRMPPYSTDSHIREMKNDISLTAEEKRILVEWIDAGAPPTGLSGEAELSKKIPPPREASSKDLKMIFEAKMEKPAEISSQGPNIYRYYQMGSATERDMWIRATNSISTNPRLLHHQILLVAPRPLKFYEDQTAQDRKNAPISMVGDVPLILSNAVEESQPNEYSRRSFRIGTWFMGLPQPSRLMGDTVAFIPKGSYLILEVHHMGSGKPETEQTTLQLFGFFEKPKNKLFDKLTFLTTTIKIPPRVRKHFEYASIVTNEDVHAHSFNAHMHMRGKAVQLSVRTPEGRTTLVTIPRFDYGLLTAQILQFKEPVLIPKGAKLVMRCEYDNSEFNLSNPDPSRTISWGQTLSDAEMCLGILGVTSAKKN